MILTWCSVLAAVSLTACATRSTAARRNTHAAPDATTFEPMRYPGAARTVARGINDRGDIVSQPLRLAPTPTALLVGAAGDGHVLHEGG